MSFLRGLGGGFWDLAGATLVSVGRAGQSSGHRAFRRWQPPGLLCSKWVCLITRLPNLFCVAIDFLAVDFTFVRDFFLHPSNRPFRPGVLLSFATAFSPSVAFSCFVLVFDKLFSRHDLSQQIYSITLTHNHYHHEDRRHCCRRWRPCHICLWLCHSRPEAC